MRRVVLAVISDTHAGHKYSLMPPGVELFQEASDGDLTPWKPSPTASQRYLWQVYTAGVDLVRELAGEDDVILIHNGDACQGIKYPQELVSTRLADQTIIALENFKPWFELPTLKAIRIALGTGAHTFGEGSAEIELAYMLKLGHPNFDVKAMHHGAPVVNGCRVDFAHHGPYPGSREWLKGNVARYYLRDIAMREILRGSPPPRLVIRAHYHTPVRETLYQNGHTLDLFITPSFQTLTDHAHQAARSPDKISHGVLALEIIDGELAGVHEFYETVDLRHKEEL